MDCQLDLIYNVTKKVRSTDKCQGGTGSRVAAPSTGRESQLQGKKEIL